MRVSASLGLVVLLAALASCEQRNYARCIPTNPDYQCAGKQYCQPNDADPNGVGTCVDSQCTVTMLGTPNGCKADAPICTSEGKCVGCNNKTQCAAVNTTQTACVTSDPIANIGICAECAVDSDCASNPATLTPACDKTTHTCRACALHSECASKVCAKDNTLASLPKPITLGMCAPTDRVLVVDQTHSLQTQVAAASADKPYVLVPSSAEMITVGLIPGLPEQHIISTTADLSPPQLTTLPTAKVTSVTTAVTVSAGASVTLEGLLIRDNALGISCNSGGTTATSVKLLRSIIMTSDLAIKTSALCQLLVDSSWIGTPPNASGANGNYVAMTLDSTQFEIVNSVFDHNIGKSGVFGGITLSDSKPGNLQGRIVNSTFYRQEGTDSTPALAVYCQAAPKALAIFNTLFVNNQVVTNKPYVDPNCYKAPNALGNYATDENPAPSGTTVTTMGINESIFTMPSTSTLTLVSTAPKSLITGGTTSFASAPAPLSKAAPLVDMQGTKRGTTSVTIGAFEVPH